MYSLDRNAEIGVLLIFVAVFLVGFACGLFVGVNLL